MGEPERLVGFADGGQRQVEHAKQDELLAKIERDGLISDWAWPRLTETVAELRALPDSVAWVGTKYLHSVVAYGDKIFGETSMDTPVRESIGCPCGGTAEVEPAREGEEQKAKIGDCDRCHTTVVQ